MFQVGTCRYGEECRYEHVPVKTLAIFDFDGTLAWTDLPETGVPRFEAITGQPWTVLTDEEAVAAGHPPSFRRKGWWSEAQSLRPPVIPEPAPPSFANRPLFRELAACQADPSTLVVVLTGRLEHLKPDVVRVLDQLGANLPANRIWCNSGARTEIFKLRTITRLIKRWPALSSVRIWEDRPEHAVSMYAQLSAMVGHTLQPSCDLEVRLVSREVHVGRRLDATLAAAIAATLPPELEVSRQLAEAAQPPTQETAVQQPPDEHQWPALS